MPTIRIPTEHLSEVVERILPFRSDKADRRPALESVLVSQAADGLRWIATDSYRMGCLYRGESDLDGPILVPAELIDFAARHAVRGDLETVTFEIDDDATVITLSQPELRVPRRVPTFDYPDADAHLFAAPAQQPSVLHVGGENLRAAIHATVTFVSSDERDQSHPVALRSDGDDTLHVMTRWAGSEDTHAFIPCSSDAPIDTLVNASYLHSLLDAAGSQGLELLVGAPTEPLRLRTSDGFYGLLMPLHLGQPDLERRIAGFLGMEHADLHVHEDGSIPLSIEGVEIIATLVRSRDPFGRDDIVSFEVSLATEVPESPEVLREINELNSRARLCRVHHVVGTVRVTADAVLATLDDEEIDAVCYQLARHAVDFGPLIQAVFHEPHGDQADGGET